VFILDYIYADNLIKVYLSIFVVFNHYKGHKVLTCTFICIQYLITYMYLIRNGNLVVKSFDSIYRVTILRILNI